MRVGFVVDGQAEYRSLRVFLDRAGAGATILRTLYADMQPHASASRIVTAAIPALRILRSQRADVVVALIDHESRTDCPGDRAVELAQSFAATCAPYGLPTVHVVVKVRAYENWLVSAPESVNALRGRFRVSRAQIRRVQPNKADNVDGQALLRQACKGKYDKVADAVQIASVLDPDAAAADSRSLRCLFRILGHPLYVDQSRLPAA